MKPRIWFLLSHALLARAHMEMFHPYPLRSKYDPQNSDGARDYDMVAPLLADGSDYPCKGYNTLEAAEPAATYTAGSTYRMSIVGGASHHGGSCQLSMSYDNGTTFQAIKSMIGGCPLPTSDYDFTVPSDAPSGTALFAWTWFNLVGNREMYMNCAEVEIQGRGRDYSRWASTRPHIFLANIGSRGRCTTVENQPLVFPEPGSDVVYGGGVTESYPRFPGPCGEEAASSALVDAASSTANILGRPSATTFSRVLRVAATSNMMGEDLSSSTALDFPSSLLGITIVDSFRPGPSPLSATGLATGGASLSITRSSASTLAPASTDSTTTLLSDTSSGSPGITNFLCETTDFMYTTLVVSETFSGTVRLSASSSLLPPSTISSTLPTPSSSQNSFPSSSQSTPSPTTPSTSPICEVGDISCLSLSEWSICNGAGTGYIPMGSVAAGTICINGRITREPSTRGSGDGFCEGADGSLRCVDFEGGGANDGGGSIIGQGFEVCDQGVWVYMGPVAAGTACRDGEIVAAEGF